MMAFCLASCLNGAVDDDGYCRADFGHRVDVDFHHRCVASVTNFWSGCGHHGADGGDRRHLRRVDEWRRHLFCRL